MHGLPKVAHAPQQAPNLVFRYNGRERIVTPHSFALSGGRFLFYATELDTGELKLFDPLKVEGPIRAIESMPRIVILL